MKSTNRHVIIVKDTLLKILYVKAQSIPINELKFWIL